LTDRLKKLGINEKLDNVLYLKLSNKEASSSIHPCYVNTLKRVFTFYIDTYNICDVDVLENNSQYHPDVLKDRLTFITIDTDVLDNYLKENDLNIKDIDVIFGKLNEENPIANNTGITTLIYLRDCLSLYDNKNNKFIEKRHIKTIFPHDSVLFSLKCNEQILIKTKISLDKGYKNTSNQACIIQYKYDCENNDDLSLSNQQNYNKIGEHPSAIIIGIENIGKISNHNIFIKGIEYIKSHLDLIKNNIIDDIYEKHIENMIAIYTFDNEDHTFGKLIETKCIEKSNHDISKNKNFHISYRIIHPLIKSVEFKICLDEFIDIKKYDAFIIECIEELIETYDNLLIDFNNLNDLNI